MREVFWVLLVVVVALAVLGAALAAVKWRRPHEEIGARGLLTGLGAADDALEREVRRDVEARNARRAARGAPPLDVDAEVARELRELGG